MERGGVDMKIVFFGTPDYVLPVVAKLYKEYGHGKDGLVAVVTQPPKQAGRKKFLKRSAVDNWAFKHKVPVIYDLSKSSLQADLGVVAAYGKIIPENIIKTFGNGVLNIHPSLLPKYRGASPTQAALIAGEGQTGISIIKMDALIDHGPIVTQTKEPIEETDTNASLRTRLFARSADILIEMLPGFLTGKIKLKEQDHSSATFTKLVKKDDGYIDVTTTPKDEVARKVRAFFPWPGAWTWVKIDDTKKRLKLLPDDLVQLEGKNPVSWKQFREGYPEFSL